jgi:hypothetical protein
MKKLKLNKKGHHELGLIPYSIIAGAIGFVVVFGQKIIDKIKKV